MLFLIRYDRIAGKLLSIRSYSDERRSDAEADRLDLEMQFALQASPPEIVLLEASDETALRLTHNRYFADLFTLTTSGDLAK